MKKYLAFGLVVVIACSCGNRSANDHKPPYSKEEFRSYWYAGKAEVNVYNLSQSRYGEVRDGKAVLIFVTEDFSKDRQVKLDDPSSDDGKVSVLKLNIVKNFVTGIYPYSMMQSVFTPVQRDEYPHTLKTSMSTQEWCGHVFTQMNLSLTDYRVVSYSYFEQEGDNAFSVKRALLEDEVWNLIRLDHTTLPSGKVEVIPALFFTRLRHKALNVSEAKATKSESDSAYSYELAYLERTLEIQFEKKFPYKILGWTERFPQGDKMQTTTATLDKTLNIDYWTKNRKAFEYLRDSLGLSRTNPFGGQ